MSAEIKAKGNIMTEQNVPDDELQVVEEDDVLLDETPGAASSLELDPVSGEPDSYPGAAENNAPTLGEAAADVDFGEAPTGLEADASDDEENFGGSPLSEFEPDDLER